MALFFACWLKEGLAGVGEQPREPAVLVGGGRILALGDEALDGGSPWVIASGPGFGGGGPGGSWLADKLSAPDMFRLAVEKRALAGAGVVKVFATGLLDFDCVGQVQHDEAVSQTELTAAVKAIEGAGLPLTVHATTAFRSWSALWPLAWAAWSTVTS